MRRALLWAYASNRDFIGIATILLDADRRINGKLMQAERGAAMGVWISTQAIAAVASAASQSAR